MPRPIFIKDEDLKRWSDQLDNDPNFYKAYLNFPPLKEVCMAGLWLCEQLERLKCPEQLILRIQYTGGKMSFGKDPWLVHQTILENYISNKLIFEDSTDNILN
jgi:hypothetical protein